MMNTARVVAITGASSGIGLACARRLAADGWRVVLSARRTDRLNAAVDGIREAGGQAVAVTGDVTREGDMNALVAAAVREFGRLDAMIANAGIGYHDNFETTPPDVLRRLVDVNVMGTLYAAHAAAGQFRAQHSGHLVVMSSIVGRRGIAGSSVYSATKAAQAGLVEALRAEWLGTGLHASVVFPVSTATEFRDVIERDYGLEVEGKGPQQSPDIIANAVARCLASPAAEVYPYRPPPPPPPPHILAPGLADRLVRRFGRRRVVGPGEHA
jgi:NADP-dependent 3-hydroxy acid dehydrogenase YdfG